ncbi:MAG: hypothetical protein IPK79_09225 [Vampirovibrionales bacterium]|nr:hypothetical protein [Vampirovibrionales bacterium]
MSFAVSSMFAQLRGAQSSTGPRFGAGAAQTAAAEASLDGLKKMKEQNVKSFATFLDVTA